MKKILITGATGFIGHYLVEHFSHDYEILCIIRPNTKNKARLNGLKNFTLIEHDLRNPFDIDKIGDVEYILHAGGNPSASDSLIDPRNNVIDNVIGTVNILDLAKSINIKRLVYYSSGEVFGPIAVGQDSYENDAYNSNSPYAAAKAAGEELCVAYSKSFNLPVSVIHINNTFGPRCQPNRLPVIIIRKLLNNEPIDIHVSNGIIGGRRWFYAGNVASHTRFILEKQTQLCEKWNSAGNTFINNLDFAKEIALIMNTELKYNLVPVDRPGHDLCFSVNPDKIYKLGWTEPKSFKERLEETVQWYMKNTDWL